MDLLMNNVSSTMQAEAAADAGAAPPCCVERVCDGLAHDPHAFLPETLLLTDATPPRLPKPTASACRATRSARCMRGHRASRSARCASRTSSSGKRSKGCGPTRTIYHFYSGRGATRTTSSTRAIAATVPASQLFDGASSRDTNFPWPPRPTRR